MGFRVTFVHGRVRSGYDLGTSSVLLFYVNVFPDCGFIKARSKPTNSNQHLSRRLSPVMFERF